ncbi:1071_t:CDS:1, partial [Gigaspora rosea]
MDKVLGTKNTGLQAQSIEYKSDQIKAWHLCGHGTKMLPKI